MQLCKTHPLHKTMKVGELEPGQKDTLVRIFSAIKRNNFLEVLHLLLTVYQRNNADDPRPDKIKAFISEMNKQPQ